MITLRAHVEMIYEKEFDCDTEEEARALCDGTQLEEDWELVDSEVYDIEVAEED